MERAQKKTIKLLLVLMSSAIVFLAGTSSSFAQSKIFHSYTTPLPAPGFSLEDLQGKAVNIRDLRGHVGLLNFWATW
jgi:cytochrome oxidase Cu insertion factor (SCO1/SenC/PrrC family)